MKLPNPVVIGDTRVLHPYTLESNPRCWYQVVKLKKTKDPYTSFGIHGMDMASRGKLGWTTLFFIFCFARWQTWILWRCVEDSIRGSIVPWCLKHVFSMPTLPTCPDLKWFKFSLQDVFFGHFSAISLVYAALLQPGQTTKNSLFQPFGGAMDSLSWVLTFLRGGKCKCLTCGDLSKFLPCLLQGGWGLSCENLMYVYCISLEIQSHCKSSHFSHVRSQAWPIFWQGKQLSSSSNLPTRKAPFKGQKWNGWDATLRQAEVSWMAGEIVPPSNLRISFKTRKASTSLQRICPGGHRC